MFAYGQKYLNDQGTMALVYPRTATFDAPLPIFQLAPGLDLWVLPFDLTSGRLVLPEGMGAWPVVGVVGPMADLGNAPISAVHA